MADDYSTFSAWFRRVCVLVKSNKRETLILVSATFVLGSGIWVWNYLDPTSWNHYTDDISFRQLTRDVDPDFAVWSEARATVGDVNLPADSAEPVFSPDGTQMIIARGLSVGDANLFLSKWDGRSWGELTPIRALNSQFHETSPCYSHDGRLLYFSTDRPGGQGGYDIWASRWDGSEFAWPLPLTQMVNSPFDDKEPALSTVDDVLYFSSNRPDGNLTEEQAVEAGEEDWDLFSANIIPAGVTNREVERALSMLYSLRTTALADESVMAKLGGSTASESAVDRALEWLASNQETNGMWTASPGKGGYKVAATSFALLSFFGRGARHDEPGKYQEVVKKGLDWLLEQQNKATGALSSGGREMYEHGIGALCLVEAYGVSKDQNIYFPAVWAVEYIEEAQNDSGGWRYTAKSKDGDLSVSGWQIMALKSAELSGIPIKEGVFDGARKFLRSVEGGASGGLYAYTPSAPGKPGKRSGKRSRKGQFSSSAMVPTGYFCSLLLGLSPNTEQAFETADGLQELSERATFEDVYWGYYATLAAYQSQGETWPKWRVALNDKFVKTQESSGSWAVHGGHGAQMGPVITTALVALSLQSHYRYTPLYGLGFKPDRGSDRLSQGGLETLNSIPVYRRAKRLYDVNSAGNDVGPYLTEHGDYLYFASDRTGGAGGYDLYRYRITMKGVYELERLGPEVNSAANETDVALRAAGFNLMFSSDRGMEDGEYRLYSSPARQVYRRHEYGRFPAVLRVIEDAPMRLMGIVIALAGFLFFVKRFTKPRSENTSPSVPQSTVDGGAS